MIAFLVGAGQSWADESPEDSSFTEAILRSTFRIFGPGVDGKIKTGTVFLLRKPIPGSEGGRNYVVLITAHHVLDDIGSDLATIRFRTRSGHRYSRLDHQLPIRSEGRPLWKKGADVDLAAMYVRVPSNADWYLAAPELLAEDSEIAEFGIGPGKQLLVLGYPYGLEANEAGFAIARTGTVASYPLVPTKATKTFLLDFEVFGGNSGGPVLYDWEQIRRRSGQVEYLKASGILGVVVRQLALEETVRSIDETAVRRLGLGVAEVVHASHVRELIDALPDPGYEQ